MRKLLLALIILAFSAPQAFALNEIIHQYRGVRSLGMGGSWVTSGLYEEALFGNPAMHSAAPTWKIAILNTTAEGNSNIISDGSKFKSALSASGADLFTKVADSGIVGHNEHLRIVEMPLGFYTPHFFGESTGFAFQPFVSEQLNVMLRNNTDVDISSYLDAGVAFGLSKRWWDGHLLAGINVRPTYRLAADRSFHTVEFLTGKKPSLSDLGGQGGGIDGDIGTMYDLPFEIPIVKFAVGGSVNNVVGSNYDMFARHVIQKVTEAPPKNVRTGNVGVRMDFDNLLLLQDNKAMVEVQDIGYKGKKVTFFKQLHMGAETKLLFKLLAVRGGFNQGYYTAGLGLNLPLLKIEAATYGEEIGANAGTLEDRRYIVRLALEI